MLDLLRDQSILVLGLGDSGLAMAAWAIVVATVGLVLFWRAETRYGRG